MWLNADILPGPINATGIPVLAERFQALCRLYFPNATLSTGWTTQLVPTDTRETWMYGWQHVREMADVIRCRGYESNYPQFTFPVRAVFASRSIKQLQWLTSVVPNSTLTVWSSKIDPLEIADLLHIRTSFPKNKVYYDVPKRYHMEFEQKKDSVNSPIQDLVTDTEDWITFTRGQTESCSSLTYVMTGSIMFGRSMATAVLRKKVIVASLQDFKVTGRIQFFNTERGQALQKPEGMQELKIVLADVSLFAKNATDDEISANTSDTEVIWSALNSSVIYTFQHKYEQTDKSCHIFKLDSSEDKTFEVWTVPCEVLLEEPNFQDVVRIGQPVISSRKRLVLPHGPFMVGFVSTGDEHVAIYDLNVSIPGESSTSGSSSISLPLGKLSAFVGMIIALCALLF